MSEVLDMETGELVPIEPGAPMSLFGTVDPERAVAEGSRYAKAIAEVLEQQKMYALVSGKKYVTVEGWQTLGSMTGVFAVGEGEPAPVEIGGVVGFKATVVAMRNGSVIGRATAYCMRDEQRWKNADTYAVASMAQTRATSKALSGPLGFIVKLAGYSATPAEEMPVEAPPEPVLATKAQKDHIHRLIDKLERETGVKESEIREGMQKVYGTQITTKLTKEQAAEFITRLKKAAGEEES